MARKKILIDESSTVDLANGAIVPISLSRQIDANRTPEGGRPILVPKGRVEVFTAEQYRAKAAEFNAFLANSSRSPNETSEFRNLAQTYTTLAENEEWMAVHLDRTVQRRKPGDDGAVLSEVVEQILRCLGGAVMMRWNTVPTKLQKELFDCASSIGDLQQEAPLKRQIARFLHDHKGERTPRVR